MSDDQETNDSPIRETEESALIGVLSGGAVEGRTDFEDFDAGELPEEDRLDVLQEAKDEPREDAGGNGKEQTPKKDSETILRQQILEGTEDLERPSAGLFLSALSAGLDLGFTVLTVTLIIYLLSEGGEAQPIVEHMLIGLVYPVGYVFILLGRSTLFTEQTTLAVLPVLDKRASLGQLARLWAVVYIGNIIGVTLFGVLLALAGPKMGVMTVESAIHHATGIMDYEWWVLVVSAVLAGWLMGLLSWLVTASRDTISQLFLVFLVTGVIGVAGLHHCIAGAGEIAMGVVLSEDITILDMAFTVALVSIGNAMGGVLFVSLLKYSLVVRSQQTRALTPRDEASVSSSAS